MKEEGRTTEEQTYNPYIIAHRGYCSVFPQNSLESIEAAIYKCHFVEFDIMLTKDNQIIIFHDRYLSQLTNIEEIVEFKDRKSVFVEDGVKLEEREDWWVKDFTCEELKKLKIRQKSVKRPQLKKMKFSIPTLEETIEQILYIKKHQLKQNKAGFLIEIKCHYQNNNDQERDRRLSQELVKILQKYGLGTQQDCKEQKFPIILQSFNSQFLKYINQSSLRLPIVHLFDKSALITKEFIEAELFPASFGIAIGQKHATKEVMEICAAKKIAVFFWTLIDDQPQRLPQFIPTIKHAYEYLFNLRINGLITQFPQKCQEYLNSYKAANRIK